MKKIVLNKINTKVKVSLFIKIKNQIQNFKLWSHYSISYLNEKNTDLSVFGLNSYSEQ